MWLPQLFNVTDRDGHWLCLVAAIGNTPDEMLRNVQRGYVDCDVQPAVVNEAAYWKWISASNTLGSYVERQQEVRELTRDRLLVL